MSRVGVIVQARMGSTRLPGKVLRPLAGEPMIHHVVTRLRRLRTVADLVVATSEDPREEPLVAWLRRAGVEVFRGDEADVLDRFVRCADAYRFDAVVRATGDNPLVDPIEGDRLVRAFLSGEGHYRHAFPTGGSGLPVGVGLEIMSREALDISHREGHAPHHREHVNELILEQPARFGCQVVEALPAHRAPDLSFTVDTEAQRRAVESWLVACGGASDEVSLASMIAIAGAEVAA